MEEFHKVRRLPPYVFEQVNRLKAAARAEGADIIDLGMGNPRSSPRPRRSSTSWVDVVRDPRTPIAIPVRAASPVCAAPKRAITSVASA